MKNNKGMSIIEIIISVTLISIIMVFLFSMLITVRGEDEKNREAANMQINQAMIIKEIETDFLEYELIGIASCADNEGLNPGTDSVRDIVPSNASLVNGTGGNCLKLLFNPAKTKDDVGYLLYYDYAYTSTTRLNVVGYKRGDKRVLREVNNISENEGVVSKKCTSNLCIIIVDLPVIDSEGDDYGIHLSYTTSNTSFNYTPGLDSKYNFNLN